MNYAECSLFRTRHSYVVPYWCARTCAPYLSKENHFQFLIKLLLFSMFFDFASYSHTIYKFITFYKYTTTSELACGETIAELSIAVGCACLQPVWPVCCAVHVWVCVCVLDAFTFYLFVVYWLTLAATTTAVTAVLMQLLSSFLEISYSSLEIDCFIGKNGIWQSGAPCEMIMFVVWYFICRRIRARNG